MHHHWKTILLVYGGASVALYFINKATWGVTDAIFWPKTLITGASGT